MKAFHCVVFCVAAFVAGLECVKIHRIQVPSVIENGTVSSVILDCDFSYEKSESQGLVVQWFFGDNSSAPPVYQWVPGKRPQDLGIFRGRINLDLKVSDDPNTMHRAIEILHPTPEFTGEYRCRVVTFDDEDIAFKTMIVYAPARSLEVWYQKSSLDIVNVTCRVEGIFPLPDIVLLTGDPQRTEIEGSPPEITFKNGLYDVTLHRILKDRHLQMENIFECVVRVPDTKYQIKRRVIYYPGFIAAARNGVGTTELTRKTTWILLCLYFTTYVQQQE